MNKEYKDKYPLNYEISKLLNSHSNSLVQDIIDWHLKEIKSMVEEIEKVNEDNWEYETYPICSKIRKKTDEIRDRLGLGDRDNKWDDVPEDYKAKEIDWSILTKGK